MGYLNSTVPRVQCIDSILVYCAIFHQKTQYVSGKLLYTLARLSQNVSKENRANVLSVKEHPVISCH